jgi:hypothetical protein
MKNLLTGLVIGSLSSSAFATTWTVDDDGKADFDNIPSSVSDDSINTEDCCEVECGTVLTPEIIKRTNQMLDDGTWNIARTHPLNSRGTQYVRITSHIVRYSDGSGGLAEDRVATAITNLNDHVASTGLVFFQDGDTLFIDSDQYADCETSEMDALRQIDVVDGSVNIYFVPETSICGRSSFYGIGVQGIVMNNYCTANPSVPNYSTFSHEVGHYFNLYHTHETYFGVECVDGSNCDSAGDLFCDTPADPGLSYLVDNSCVYIGTELDACGSGDPYTPSTENLMSYSTKWCRDTFTTEQLSMFLWSAENQRADHIVNSDCPGDINGDGYVNVTDLLVVIDAWGLTNSPADVNGDGIVDVSDLLDVVGNWGPCE